MKLNLYHNFSTNLFSCLFGLQTTQIHLNYWSEKEFNKFSNLIYKNREKVVSYDEALKLISFAKTDKIINNIIRKLLILKRKFKS